MNQFGIWYTAALLTSATVQKAHGAAYGTNFPVGDTQARDEVQEIFEHWVAYLIKKRKGDLKDGSGSKAVSGSE